MPDSTTQSVLFPDLFVKLVVVAFDQEHSSSDGGALLLKAVDDRLGISERLAACVGDPRQPGKVRHAMLDLLRLRGRSRRITVDMDPTDDPTHGQQELAFYNGHYQSWCYQPVVVKLTFDEEAEQHVVAVVVRPGDPAGS